MKKVSPLILAASAIVCLYGCTQMQAAAAVRDDPSRGAIELVVYSGNFAMVREMRRVDLSAGRARIGIQGVSKSLDQNSVLFSWPRNPDAKVVSSTYDLGVSDSGHLLTRLLGKEVELVYHGMDGRAGERIRGTLEVAEPSNVVIKSGGRYIVNPSATIEAPTHAGIVTIPQLSAEVESKSGGPTDLSVAYMTEGLSWNADYSATLTPESESMGLECWATVTNKTGTDFPDAQISFVAGSPNRAVRNRDYEVQEMNYGRASRAKMRGAVDMGVLPSAGFSPVPETMGELYAYPYKSTATIRQDQMNRVRMMDSEKVKVKKYYSVALPYISRDYTQIGGNPDHRISATMGLNFQNAEASGLGQPMPAGAIRVYEPDKSGTVRYVGAASMGDTPKDARVNLTLTDVFDVYARIRQVSAKKIDKKRTQRTVEVKVSNEKSRPVEVRLVQNLGRNWKVVSQTLKGQKLNAGTNQWTVPIRAGGEFKLVYTVELAG